MRKVLVVTAVIWLLAPVAAHAQDARATLAAAAKALGADGLTSIEYAGAGTLFAVGQSITPGASWPRFAVDSFTRSINYDTGVLREEEVRSQGEHPPRGGGVQPVRGQARAVFVLAGDYAWNTAESVAIPAPITLAERQLQLWATPHGVIKAAQAGKGTVQGRTITFALPGRFTATAFLDGRDLVERVEATLANPVVGDLPVVITYGDYRDFAGVKFPTRVQQSAGGFPVLDVTVTAVRPNAAVDIAVPDPVRQTPNPYARVTTQMVTDGVWYLTGGTHHSVVIEMKDHVVVVEAPLNDARAAAVIAETKSLVPNKPIKYLVTSHHHFDHTGGVRAFAAEGITIVTHESNRAFFELALGAPATIAPDRLARSGQRSVVEGVKDRRVLTDGTRTIELHHIAGNDHAAGLLMAYLPTEKLVVEADVFTPGPANAPPPAPVSPFAVQFADTLTRLHLAPDVILPLHGRMVPAAELLRTIGRTR